MPISAEQWRVKTGMINASRGFRPHSIKSPLPLCDFPIPPPPPSDWKGYSLALTLLCLPLLYKIYALGAVVMMYLVRGENYGLGAQDSYGMADAHLHHGHWSSVLLLLLSVTSYLTMTLAAFLMGVYEYSERYNYQLVLIHPLHHLKFLCWFNMEGGDRGGLQMAPKIVNGCVYATLVMDPPSTLQCVHTSVKTANRKATGISVTFVSFVLQLSTIALAMLLLLGGDVERNPGPSLGLDDITTLLNELEPAETKYYNIGLHLGIKPEKIETIKLDNSGTEDRLRTILLFWLRGNTAVEVCWESIIKALIKVDRKELARELMEKYCPNEKETLFDGGNQVPPQIAPQQTSGQMRKQPLAGATAAGAQQQNRPNPGTPKYSENDLSLGDDVEPVPIKECNELCPKQLREKVELILHTCNSKENQAVLKSLAPPTVDDQKITDQVVYDHEGFAKIGMFGKKLVAVPFTGQGDTALRCLRKAMETYRNVKAIIGLGVGYGNAENAKICLGDVMVSEKIVKGTKRDKGDEYSFAHTVPVNAKLLEHARGVYLDWSNKKFQVASKPDRKSNVHLGTIVSTNTLVRAEATRKKLMATDDKAIGGEMEGWVLLEILQEMLDKGRIISIIVVKGVADLGDEKKDKVWQPTAALAAVHFLHFVLRYCGPDPL